MTRSRGDDLATQRRRPWTLRAAAAGISACAIGAAVATAQYVGLPGADAMDWSRLAPAIVLFALVGGISIGLGLGGGMCLLRGRVLGAALGGAVGAIAPGVYGIAGFGSLVGPYAGTANILGSTLLAATVFVGLWAPRLASSGPSTVAGRLGLSLLSATICAASIGVLGWTLVTTLHLVPSFCWLKHTAHAIGIVPFALLASAAIGAAGGAFVGAATSVYVSLAAVVAGRPAR